MVTARVWWCLVCCVLSTTLTAQDTLRLSALKGEIRLSQAAVGAYLIHNTRDPEVAEAQGAWALLNQLSEPRKGSACWMRFWVYNDLPDSAYVDIVATQADSAYLWAGTAGGPYTISQLTGPFVNVREWVFPEYPELLYVSCPPGTYSRIMLRISSIPGRPFGMQQIYLQPRPITLEEVVSGYRTYNVRTEFNGFFLGAVVAMMLFFLFLYFRAREKALLYYAFYLTGVAGYSLIVKSIPYSELSKVAYLSLPLTYQLGEPVQYLFFAAYAAFGKYLLDIDARYRVLNRALTMLIRGLLAAGSLLLIANLVDFNYAFQEKAFVLTRVIILPAAVGLVLWVAWEVKSPVKWFFVVGSAAFLLGGLLAFLVDPKSRHLFFGSTYLNPVIAFKSGILAESLCFALALGYKIRLTASEKENAVRAYVGQLQLNRQLVATENERLESMVAGRTAEVIEKNRQLDQQQQQQRELDFQKKLAEMEMQALRSQMNPHFIFNSLNSIRYQILKGEYEQASRYLTRFARMLRQILNNSREPVITLSEEIDLIRLYLELEQLRFGKDFEYEVSVAGALDTGIVCIPSMLLQPYVENALKHGLVRSARRPRRLSVRIRGTGFGYQYEIEDNGIGRKAAGAVIPAHRQESLGLKINNERIALFNADSEDRLKVIFEDLEAPDGQALGTRVIIRHRRAADELGNRSVT